MMKNIILFILIGVIVACAQTVPLTGGIKDINSPRIDTLKSFPKNGSINFNGQEIKLYFDEYIKLKNPKELITITPTQTNPPTYKSKNKKLSIKLNDTLAPNTTYTISFNGAVTDYNEGNDSVFQYVFSTGDYIDSLSVKGQLNNAFLNTPSQNFIVGLYDVSDSISLPDPSLLKPNYFSQSNKKGEFEINYIKNGTYYVYVFKDINKSLTYDKFSEEIGFISESITIDSNINLNINLNTILTFLEIDSSHRMKSSKLEYPGKYTLVFENKLDSFSILNNSKFQEEKTGEKDSLIYWLNNSYNNSIPLIVQHNNKVDSLKLLMKNTPKKGADFKIKHSVNLLNKKLLPNDTLTITYNVPIISFDNKLIKGFDKDSNDINLNVSIANVTSLKVNNSNLVFLKIDSGAITFNYDLINTDSVEIAFDKLDSTYYGTLNLKSNFENGIIQILDLNGKILHSVYVSNDQKSVLIKTLLPGKYNLRYIKDINEDQIWTTGDLINMVQPESVYYYTETFKIRSNWDFELEWLINE